MGQEKSRVPPRPIPPIGYNQNGIVYSQPYPGTPPLSRSYNTLPIQQTPYQNRPQYVQNAMPLNSPPGAIPVQLIGVQASSPQPAYTTLNQFIDVNTVVLKPPPIEQREVIYDSGYVFADTGRPVNERPRRSSVTSIHSYTGSQKINFLL